MPCLLGAPRTNGWMVQDGRAVVPSGTMGTGRPSFSAVLFSHGGTPGLVPFHELHGYGPSHPPAGSGTVILLCHGSAHSGFGRFRLVHRVGLVKAIAGTRSVRGRRVMAPWAPIPLLSSPLLPRRRATPATPELCSWLQDSDFPIHTSRRFSIFPRCSPSASGSPTFHGLALAEAMLRPAIPMPELVMGLTVP